MTGPVVVASGAGWLLLFLVLAASIVTSLVILVEQELRNRRAPILALSCEIRRVDASAPRAADAPVGPLSVSVTNGGPTPVRAVLIAIERPRTVASVRTVTSASPDSAPARHSPLSPSTATCRHWPGRPPSSCGTQLLPPT